MNKKAPTTIFHKYKKTAALVFLILFSAGFSYHVITTFPTRHIKSGTTNSHPKNPYTDLKNIGENWWEAGRFIYHDIPARIVFLLPPATGNRPDAVNEAIWLEFDRIGDIFNPFKPDSEISRINSLVQSDSISVSDDVNSVIRISQLLWVDSSGQFDPTMWQIKRLWQNAEKNQQIPSEKDIAAALQWTGFDKIRLDENIENSIEFENHPIKFDFGGIVKGYAVDQARQILLNSGVTAGLVQLGGEISAFGKNNKKPWRIGIQHPKQMDKVWGVLLSNKSLRISTSGNYRQPIKINGQSFYHIFSPKTGKPVSEKILGVTTACLNGKNANARLDGIATAITVMGAAKGLALAEKLKIDVLILYEKRDGTIGELMTPGFLNNYKSFDN
ncbi:MAG: FAD:protein FMN transferase [Desulfobacteraceae bacterium]|nr:FAD:protein FMN transferase [Desulfobacteraceae bacterium]MBC2755270.1 FAD:protein FMN transferase [Desulfobacteraceae bacterium]